MSKKRLTRRDFLKAAAGAAAAVPLLEACAPAATPIPVPPTATPVPAKPTVVTKKLAGITVKCAFIGGANYEEMYKAIPKFEEETGAKVEIVYKGDGFQIDKKLKTDFAAGTVDYDVCWDHTSFFSQYVKADALEPLEGYFTEAELADFIPRILNAARTKGHLWQIPRHFDVSCLHWRTDLMTEKDVPETWDQFKELAIKLTDPAKGIYGTQFAGKEEALTGRFYEVLLAEGGKLFDENWKPTFNAPPGVKAIQMFRDLYVAKAMPPGMTSFVWEDVAKNWVTGIIAMYTEWYGWYSYFQDPKASKVAGKFDLARQPVGDGKIHSGWAGAHAFSIPKAARNKEAGAALIKFLTNEEQAYNEGKLGFSPVRNSTWGRIIKDAEASAVPLDKKRLQLCQLQAQEDFTTPPLIAEWLPMSDILYPILQSIILGDKKAKEGLDEATTKVEKLMADAGYYK